MTTNTDSETNCPTCITIPENPQVGDYIAAIHHWTAAVAEGRAKVISGDGPISAILTRIEREDKFVYEHRIRCECGAIYRCAVCIRSATPILTKTPPQTKRKTSIFHFAI